MIPAQTLLLPLGPAKLAWRQFDLHLITVLFIMTPYSGLDNAVVTYLRAPQRLKALFVPQSERARCNRRIDCKPGTIRVERSKDAPAEATRSCNARALTIASPKDPQVATGIAATPSGNGSGTLILSTEPVTKEHLNFNPLQYIVQRYKCIYLEWFAMFNLITEDEHYECATDQPTTGD